MKWSLKYFVLLFVFCSSFYRWIEKKTDDEVFYWVKICALLHGQIVVYGNVKEAFHLNSSIYNKIIVFQVLTKETPFITKGAFALFYGEPTAVAQLPKTKEFLMTILLLFSLVFNVAVMVFKKLRFRSGSRQNNLNELIVGNFLNLMSFTIE